MCDLSREIVGNNEFIHKAPVRNCSAIFYIVIHFLLSSNAANSHCDLIRK